MGIIDFLKKLFGGKSSQKKAKKSNAKKNSMGIVQAKNYLNEIESKQFSAMEQKIFAKFAEIKHLLKEISLQLTELNKVNVIDEGENKRLRRIVETTKQSSFNQLNKLIERLNPPMKNDFKELKNYCVNSHQLLQSEIQHFGRNLAYTSIVLKEQMKELGAKMQELNSVFIELNELFQKNPVLSAIPLMKEELLELDSELGRRRNSQNFEKQCSIAVNELKQKRKELLEEIDAKKTSSQAQELNELTQQKNELLAKKNKIREKIFELMSGVEKPMRRFLQLSEAGGFPMAFEEKELLNEYLSNPFNAVKKDIKAEKLKKFLSQLKPLIENETIGLKDKEKEKKLAAVDFLLSFNFFDNVFWELNKVETQFLELSKQIEKIELNRKLNYLEAELKRIEKELEDKQIELIKTKAVIEKSSQSLQLFQHRVRQISAEHFDEEIEVEID